MLFSSIYMINTRSTEFIFFSILLTIKENIVSSCPFENNCKNTHVNNSQFFKGVPLFKSDHPKKLKTEAFN